MIDPQPCPKPEVRTRMADREAFSMSRCRNRLDPRLSIAWIGLVLTLTGCQGNVGPLRRWASAGDRTLAHPITDEEIGDDRNFVAKWLNPKASVHAGDTRRLLTPTKADPETEAEIKTAEALYQQGNLKEAEAALVKIDAKNIAERGSQASSGTDEGLAGKMKALSESILNGTPKPGQATWGEKVLFLLAECQYQQGEFVRANETYQKLATSYPGSPHLDVAVKRVYAIASEWLDGSDPDAKSEHSASWTDHFNGRKPLVDADGYAIKALDHIRVWDPKGPLADDSVMKVADHYLAKGAYEDAAYHYDQIRTDMAKSPLLKRAQLGSIEARMRAYSGPSYDGSGLELARQTINEITGNFADLDQKTRDDLYHKRDIISNEMAHAAFQNGEFYKRTGYVSGAEYYFGEVRAKYPKTEWAEKSKVELASLAKAPRKIALPSKILTLPGAPDPNAMGNSMGAMNTMPGAGGMMGGGGGMPGAGTGP